MKKFIAFCCIVLASVVSSLCRDYTAQTFDKAADWCCSLIGKTPSVSPELAQLDIVEKKLQDDRESLRTMRTEIRQKLRNAEEKRLANQSQMQAAEANAIRYRNALIKAQLNEDMDEIIIDRMVFSESELTAQIRSLLGEYDSLKKSNASFAELINEAGQREQNIMSTLAAVEHALDRIPLQRMLLTSNHTTESAAGLVADIHDIKQAMDSNERAGKILTGSEIEARRKATIEPVTSEPNEELLEAFLQGEDVFATK